MKICKKTDVLKSSLSECQRTVNSLVLIDTCAFKIRTLNGTALHFLATISLGSFFPLRESDRRITQDHTRSQSQLFFYYYYFLLELQNPSNCFHHIPSAPPPPPCCTLQFVFLCLKIFQFVVLFSTVKNQRGSADTQDIQETCFLFVFWLRVQNEGIFESLLLYFGVLGCYRTCWPMLSPHMFLRQQMRLSI